MEKSSHSVPLPLFFFFFLLNTTRTYLFVYIMLGVDTHQPLSCSQLVFVGFVPTLFSSVKTEKMLISPRVHVKRQTVQQVKLH